MVIDCTSKPKLPIFILIITITLNISIILLLYNTSSTISSTNLSVKFCGVSSLEVSFNDIPMSFICNPSKSPTFFLLLIPIGSNISSGLKSLNDGPSITIIVAPKVDVVVVD